MGQVDANWVVRFSDLLRHWVIWHFVVVPNRPVWPQARQRPTNEDPVPDWLDWEGFLGPARWRPYVGPSEGSRGRGAYNPFNWLGCNDFLNRIRFRSVPPATIARAGRFESRWCWGRKKSKIQSTNSKEAPKAAKYNYTKTQISQKRCI